ncbi:unnamed protein product [Rhizoctonia solani]|uniref:Peptidase C14 caspase domain-containing protein n=1 Tax=Rhizoctonia solani TaxID=456999 RepID=A0A8H3GVY4_9AGAM|nr:unnamed protein product [Rhizoctonia solani]
MLGTNNQRVISFCLFLVISLTGSQDSNPPPPTSTMPTIILLPPQLAPHATASTGTQTELSLRQGAIIIKTTSLACMRVSKICLVREPHARDALSATQSISRLASTTHWDTLRLTLAVMLVILSVLGLLALIVHVVCPGEFDKIGTFSGNETKGLLRTVPPSTSTGLHQDYQACRFNDSGQIPNRPRRGLNKPLQSLELPNFILGDGHLVMSPVESAYDPLELLSAAATSRPSDVRGRKIAVAQKSGSIGFDIKGPNPNTRTVKSQAQELTDEQGTETSEDQTQVQVPSNKPAPEQMNESRAQTDPCAKYRLVPLIKSLTGLVSVQRTTAHILGVGMSWDGIGDGSRSVLPGPPHDMKWLRNVFASQENFRFKYLLDCTATLDAVRQSLEDMHSVAGENDFIVLYLSGHGAENDSFELYDPNSPDNSALLNETMLNEWIIEFRSKSRSETRRTPVYIIFDFCRPSLVKPKTALDSGVNVIWACSPTESALDLKLKAPNRSLPRSCFLLSLILAVDDVSADPTAPVVGCFTSRMKEFVKVIRGLQCYQHKCRRPAPWRCCRCDNCLGGKHCVHDNHAGDLPFQVVSIGGIEGNSELAAVVRYIARHFPLDIKKAADQVAKDHWILYFNPSRISTSKQPLNPRNRRLGINPAIDNSNVARNMTIPVKLVRF